MRTAEGIAGAGFLGSLTDTALPEVFQRIAQESKSGDLQVTLRKAIKTVYFDRGFVVFASSNLKNDRLGESMIEAGRISRHEFALATMVMRSSKRKFGETLVEAGIVSEEELGQYVARQVNRIVLSLFSAREGMYSFDERACTIPVGLMVSLSVYRILLEGARRMTSKRLVLAGLPPLDTKLAIVREPPFNLDVEKLRHVERDVLRAARDGARISEIVRMVAGNDGVALRAIYGLSCAGVLEVAAAEPSGRILQVQEETGSFVLSEIRRKAETLREPAPVPEPAVELEFVEETKAPEPVVQGEPAPPLVAPHEPAPTPWVKTPMPSSEDRTPSRRREGLRARLLAVWQVAWDPIEAALLRWVGSSGVPPETLETLAPTSRGARQPAERRSPVTARDTAPPAPRIPDEKPASAAAEVSDEVGVPTWSIASTPEEPEEDAAPRLMEAPSWSIHDEDREREADAPASTGPVGVPSWSVLDPSDGAAIVPLSALDSELFIETGAVEDEEPSMLSQIPVEEIALAEEAVEIEMEVEDPFRELGDPIRTEAEPLPVTGATPQESSSPHAPAPAAVVDDELTTEERATASREDAMRRMKQSGGEGRLLRDVKLHFKLQDWESAVPLLEQLVAISPGTALYRGMLARAMSRVPALRKDAEEHFVEALRLAPQDPELHYWLGLYYKTFGLASRATIEFRTALRIDPKHAGARKQLSGGRKDDAIGTVLKKIFG